MRAINNKWESHKWEYRIISFQIIQEIVRCVTTFLIVDNFFQVTITIYNFLPNVNNLHVFLH